jgi:hypothetical protein
MIGFQLLRRRQKRHVMAAFPSARRSTTSVAARSRRGQFRKTASELSTEEQSQASLRRGQRARRAASARRRWPEFRSRGGHGCQEALMISAVSGSAAGAALSADWVAHRGRAFDCLSR